MAADRLAVLTACLHDDHDDCPAWVPDPCPDDLEDLTVVVCVCACHDCHDDHDASHVETPEMTLEGALPPF